VTLEGDEIVMSLQTSRSLIKKGRKLLSGKQANTPKKITDYLNELPEFSANLASHAC